MKTKRKRPDELQGKTIKEAKEENKDSLHRINKRKVSVHSAGDGTLGDGEVSGLFVPSAEDLVKINNFTKVEVTADDVAAFSIDAMNDLYDRDDERFTPDTVDEFAALPQPFSFVGKSYMADHEYKIGNTRGRIFDVGTKSEQTELGKTKFLTSQVYTPKTAQYADFLENLKFGMNWAVSVGVVVDKSECSICSAPVYTSRFFGWAWCDNGHEKGYYYVPGKEEDDGYGWFVPVDPSTKGAVKAMVDLKDAIDGYEISQVFLGAQYMAQLGEKSPVAKIFAAAERAKLPIVGLSSKEAEKIKLPSEPDEVQEARDKFEVRTEDGIVKWADQAGLVWSWDSTKESEEILCLGKTPLSDASDSETAEKAKVVAEKISELRELVTRGKQAENETDDEDDDPVELAEALDAILDEADEALDDGEVDQAEALIDGAEVIVDELVDVLGGTDPDEVDDPPVAACPSCGHVKDVKTVTAKEVLSAALKAKLPQSAIDQIAKASGSGLKEGFVALAKLIKGEQEKLAELEPKAVLGDRYIKDLEADVIHWFTVARRDPKNPDVGVKVGLARKMIEKCEGDPDTLKELIEDYKAEARAKFPQATRRSTGTEDPNERTTQMPEVPFGPQDVDRRTQAVARRLHSTGKE